MGCGCGKKNNGNRCCGHTHNGFVDVSCQRKTDWVDADSILGLDQCGNIISVDKPEYELTEGDVEKLDSIIIDGTGNKYLADDGKYYPIEQPTDYVVNGTNVGDVNINGTNNIGLNSANNTTILSGGNSSIQASSINIGDRIPDSGDITIGSANRNVNIIGLESKLVVGSSIELNTDSDLTTKAVDIIFTGDEFLWNGKKVATIDQIPEQQRVISTVSLYQSSTGSGFNYTYYDADGNLQSDRLVLSNVSDNFAGSLTPAQKGIYDSAVDDVTRLKQDVDDILDDLSNREHFRGYVTETSELDYIPNPKSGDYVNNGETGTIWAYNGTIWDDTNNQNPTTVIVAGNDNPLMDSVASPGTSTDYSRVDHRHPSDALKADLVGTKVPSSQLQDNILIANENFSIVPGPDNAVITIGRIDGKPATAVAPPVTGTTAGLIPSSLYNKYEGYATQFLPLSGGTVTGDLNINGKFTHTSTRLLTTNNIDELYTQGVYYITGGTTLPQGTFPDNYSQSSAGLFYIDQTNQQGAYRQTLYNGTRLFSRTISQNGALGEWNEFARSSEVSNRVINGFNPDRVLINSSSPVGINSTSGNGSVTIGNSNNGAISMLSNNISIGNGIGSVNINTSMAYYNGQEIATVDTVRSILRELLIEYKLI